MMVLDVPAVLPRVECLDCHRPLTLPASRARERGEQCAGLTGAPRRRASMVEGQQELDITCPVPGDHYTI